MFSNNSTNFKFDVPWIETYIDSIRIGYVLGYENTPKY